MSNIAENLRKILDARFGKDVRQAIHDSIHDCYEDGRAGATDLTARESIISLGTQITTINGELNNKANADHNHDGRYYTETEIDTMLSGKAATLSVVTLTSDTVSVTADGKTAITFDLSSYESMVPLGLIGYNISSSKCFVYRLQLNRTTKVVTISLHNMSTSTVTSNATIDVLFQAVG